MAQEEQRMYELAMELRYRMEQSDYFKAEKIAYESHSITGVGSIADRHLYKKGETALIKAVQEYLPPLVKALLFTQPDLSILDSDGRSVFDYAIDKPDLFVLLLDYQKNQIDKNPALTVAEKTDAFNKIKPSQKLLDSCLFAVAQTRDIESAKKLFSYGANVNAAIRYGSTPMMVLMESYHYNPTNLDMLKLFLNQNPDLTIHNGDGYTAKDYCGRPEVVSLIEEHVKAHPLSFKKAYEQAIQEALTNPYSLNNQDGHLGYTPLMKALLIDDKDSFIALLEQGADLSATSRDIENRRSETVHQMALRLKKADYVFLIHKFFDIESEKYHRTFDYPTYLSAESNRRMANRLLINGCIRGDLESVQEGFKQGADINATGWENYTPLMYAVHFGYKDIVEELLNKQPMYNRYIDIYQTNAHRETAQKIAFDNKDTYMLTLLNKYGRDKYGDTYPQYVLSGGRERE